MEDMEEEEERTIITHELEQIQEYNSFEQEGKSQTLQEIIELKDLKKIDEGEITEVEITEEDYAILSENEILESELEFLRHCFKDNQPPDVYDAQRARSKGQLLEFKKRKSKSNFRKTINLICTSASYINQLLSVYKLASSLMLI